MGLNVSSHLFRINPKLDAASTIFPAIKSYTHLFLFWLFNHIPGQLLGRVNRLGRSYVTQGDRKIRDLPPPPPETVVQQRSP
jgi:hypothetical protein